MTGKCVGPMIRNIRLEKKITINEVAQRTGLTASFISQFERGLTQASIASMQKIAQAIGIRMSDLFNEETELTMETADLLVAKGPSNPIVVRKAERKTMIYPEPEKTVKYLLTGLDGKFEVIYTLVEPGGGSGGLYSHESDEECLVVLKGSMEVNVGGKIYVLEEGDAITFSSRIPHGWQNIGAETAELIWVIAPPTF